MSFAVKPHLPLISTRIRFNFQALQPAPTISLRQDHGKHIKRQIRRSRTPYERKVQARRSTTPLSSSPALDSELSELSNDEDSEDEGDATSESKGRIPKPPGEAGRSNCGGFNLEKALNWDGDKYSRMIAYINEQVTTTLKADKCFSNQKADAIRNTIQMTTKKFGIQDLYVNDWPVREALKLRLKYTSELARKQAHRKTEKSLKKVVLAASSTRRGNTEDGENEL